jgi:hypothetical protein
MQMVYVDRVECPQINVVRNATPIKYWTKANLSKREVYELKNGGFGLGKLRDLYKDVEGDEGEVEVKVEKDELVKTENKEASGEAGTEEEMEEPANLKVCIVMLCLIHKCINVEC